MDNTQKSKLRRMAEGYKHYTNDPILDTAVKQKDTLSDTPEEFKAASDRFKAVSAASPDSMSKFNREIDLKQIQKQQEDMDYFDIQRQMGETPEAKLDAENKYQKIKALLGQ